MTCQGESLQEPVPFVPLQMEAVCLGVGRQALTHPGNKARNKPVWGLFILHYLFFTVVKYT